MAGISQLMNFAIEGKKNKITGKTDLENVLFGLCQDGTVYRYETKEKKFVKVETVDPEGTDLTVFDGTKHRKGTATERAK